MKLSKSYLGPAIAILAIVALYITVSFKNEPSSDNNFIQTEGKESTQDRDMPSTNTSPSNSYPSPYTRDELLQDPTAPSKDPRDYDSNGQFVPHNGPSKNAADYNSLGEYKPIEKMSKKEMEEEFLKMLENNGY
ncbi:hypothetical protein ABE137_03955 [Brevibacillus laterosporus]|uniref:hypothetical protein n=1 Tax=Brevibacillus laterosporus TaxID=1465 RepID=UPI003D237C49